MKKIFCLLLLVFCSMVVVVGQSLIGHYKTGPMGGWDKIKFFVKGIDSYEAGGELYLYKDSTFKRISCGNILTGSWRTNKSELVLSMTANRWRLDSLARGGKKPDIQTAVIHYTIDENKLYEIIHTSDGQKHLQLLYKQK